MKYSSGSVHQAGGARQGADPAVRVPAADRCRFRPDAAGKAETVLVERIRAEVTDFVAPIMGLMSRPVATLTGNRCRHQRARPAARGECEAPVAKTSGWSSGRPPRASCPPRTTDSANSCASCPSRTFISPPARGGGRFERSVRRSIIAAAGARAGIAKGQAVVAGGGLTGRVQAVGDSSARVLLLTDLNSRVPVMLEESRERAILAGDNSARPQIQFLRHAAAIRIGERVVTSGRGGVLPPVCPSGSSPTPAGKASASAFSSIRPGSSSSGSSTTHRWPLPPGTVRARASPRGAGR